MNSDATVRDPRKSPIILAGMHRSGTSALTRMLSALGLNLGSVEDHHPAQKDNPDGFWEHQGFHAINEEILEIFGGGWDIPPSFPHHWVKDGRLDPLRDRALKIASDLAGSAPWGWKDPRNTLTLPFWRDLYPKAKIVTSIRNPVNIYRSLERRAYASKAFSFRLTELYLRSVQSYVFTDDALVVHYEALLDDPEAELKRASDYCCLKTDSASLQSASASIRRDSQRKEANLLDLYFSSASGTLVGAYVEQCFFAGPRYEPLIKAQWDELLLHRNRPEFLEKYRILRTSSERLKPPVSDLDKTFRHRVQDLLHREGATGLLKKVRSKLGATPD